MAAAIPNNAEDSRRDIAHMGNNTQTCDARSPHPNPLVKQLTEQLNSG